jgi:hypothetical protein
MPNPYENSSVVLPRSDGGIAIRWIVYIQLIAILYLWIASSWTGMLFEIFGVVALVSFALCPIAMFCQIIASGYSVPFRVACVFLPAVQ